MKGLTFAQIFWLAWVAVGAGYEGYALATNYRNTLSEQIWGIEGHAGSAVQWFVGAFTFWLAIHLTFRVLR